MKFNALRLVFIVCLLLIVNVSYGVGTAQPPASKKVDDSKDKQENVGRSTAMVPPNSVVGDLTFYKNRVESLEERISKQDTLIHQQEMMIERLKNPHN